MAVQFSLNEISISAVTEIALPPVGEVQLMTEGLAALPSVNITTILEAANRLLALKTRVNELYRFVYEAKNQRAATIAGSTLGAFISFGLSLAIGTGTTVHLNATIDKCNIAITNCIDQINLIRSKVGSHPQWSDVEKEVTINRGVFESGVERSCLRGSL